MAFKLSIYPWVHSARFNGDGWDEEYIEQEHMTPEEENAMSEADHTALVNKRNNFPHLPLVNYTTQYGLGCFEGLKAFPQPDGSLKLFRPDRNCRRMASSMKGLMMPPIDEPLLLEGIVGTVRRNAGLGFAPSYDPEWEKDSWQSGGAVYIRPFAYSEPGIGINLSRAPWVITVCTTVSAYFTPGKNEAVTSERVRATPKGTGWIKAAANYVTSTLAKTEAIQAGFMEAIFLDAATHKNIEEGSSCNFFALFPGGKLVTPSLHDTILPGITRESVMKLAEERGLDVVERDLAVSEVLNDAVECFVTGTAAGITPLGSLTHQGQKGVFSSLKDDSLSMSLLRELKGIQYGAVEDRHGWMKDV
ncbi:MAG: aminotransferase class IV [Spirochaetaceae bacterium]|nr:aminotransferase class IV [Spirochaetaceae bacterium]